MLFSEKIFYYDPAQTIDFQNFQDDLRNQLKKRRKTNQPLVFVCVGTDRATGDCLGPLVGHYLMHHSGICSVYGNLNKPIHAQNLESTMNTIYQTYKDPFIIAIDACLGCQEHIGYITLSSMPLLPGQGVSKNLPPIGHLSITGIVNLMSDTNEETIQNTRLQIVVELASFISSGIETSITVKSQASYLRT